MLGAKNKYHFSGGDMPVISRTASLFRILCLVAACQSLPAQAVQTITLATINNLTSRINGILLQEVYRRAGIQLEIVVMPPSRVTAMSWRSL